MGIYLSCFSGLQMTFVDGLKIIVMNIQLWEFDVTPFM